MEREELNEKILNEFKEFVAQEYIYVKRGIENRWGKPKELINDALSRCLGVAIFIQCFDVDYVDYEKRASIYNGFKAKVEELREKIVDN